MSQGGENEDGKIIGAQQGQNPTDLDSGQTLAEDCRPPMSQRQPARRMRPLGPLSPGAFACPGCNIRFVLGGLHPKTLYRCVHCGADILPSDVESSSSDLRPSRSDTGQQQSGVIYLYGRTERRSLAMAEDPEIASMGRYRIDSELGRGGMGVVYRAWDRELARPVALKVMLGGRFAQPRAVERFALEARAAAGLDHRAIVRVLDVGEMDGQAFFAMDLVEGVPLHDVLAATLLPLRESLRIVLELARALEVAHAAGVVHRDIKPPNILVSSDGRIFLSDFGLAKDLHVEGQTGTGAMLGTPSYMAPEQAEGQAEIDYVRADQYALGAVLYEMATGHRAFSGTAPVKVLASVIESAPPEPRSLRPDLPRDVELICLTAMAREPQRRYSSMQAMADDIGRFLGGQPIEARPTSLTYRARLFTRRNARVLTGVVTTVAVTAAIVGLSLAWRYRGEYVRQQNRERAASERLLVVEKRINELTTAERFDEVNTLFASYAEAEEHQGTAALAEAWLGRAGRKVLGGDPEAELDSLARAYIVASSGKLRERALWGLVEAFRRRGWHDRLDSVAAVLPEAAETTELVLTAALARRDMAQALVILDQGGGGSAVAPMVRSLARMTEIGHVTEGDAWVLGPGRLAFPVGEPEPLLRTVDGGGEVIAESRFPAELGIPHSWRWLDDKAASPGLLIGHFHRAGTEQMVLLDLRGAVMTESLTWSERSLLSTTVLSDALGGPPTVLVGTGPYTRTVLALDRASGSWSRREIGAELGLVESDVNDLLAIDLTGDGRDELVVASGPWAAFDVRVYRPGPTGFERLARRKMGTVVRLQPFRLAGERVLAVAKARLYPSLEMFPDSRPYGDPAGIYLFALVDGELVERAYLPLPQDLLLAGDMFLNLEVGDFDGDGRDDLALFSPLAGNTLIVERQLEDGSFAEFRLANVLLRDVGQLDDDPATEIVVTIDDSLWVLGRGSSWLPPLAKREAKVTGPPESLERALQDDWLRAEQLVSMGLESRAAVAFERLAALSTVPDAAGWALLRAGRLWDIGGAPGRAAAAYLGASSSPELEAEALLAAVRAQKRDLSFAPAIASLARLLDHPDLDSRVETEARQLAAAISAVADHSAETVLTFSAPLGPGWQVTDPLSVHRDARAGEMVIDSWVAHRGEIVSFPLERVSDDLTLGLELRFERNEWASGIRFRLRPRGTVEAGIGFEVHTWGGGGLLRDVAGCFVPDVDRGWVGPPRPFLTSFMDATCSEGMTATVLVSPSLGESVCRIVDRDGQEVYWESQPLRLKPHGREWELIVEARGVDDLSHPLAATARVGRITLGGFRPAPAVAGRGDPGALVWAEGDSLAASKALRDPLAKALALAELGRWDQVRLSATDFAPWRLGVALRVRPHLAQALFRRVLGPQFYRLWARAFEDQVSMIDDDAFTAGIPGQLAGLDELSAGDPLRAVLLKVRGVANWDAGRLGAAVSDLERAAEGALNAGDVAAASESFRYLAFLAAEAGDGAGARMLARRSVEVARFPDLAVDLLRRDSRLAALLSAF